jgi:hypothetical protein
MLLHGILRLRFARFASFTPLSRNDTVGVAQTAVILSRNDAAGSQPWYVDGNASLA